MQKLAMMPLAAALTLALAAPGFGQATGAGVQGKAPAQSPAQSPAQTPADKAAAPTQSPAQSQATPSAAPAEPPQSSLQSQLEANNTQLQTHKKLEVIKVKGAMASAQARAKADTKLGAASKKTDADVTTQGDATVAARLGAEFGVSAEELATERQSLGCSWGELMIAHSLRAMSTTEVSPTQLFELRKEQIGWAQIAAGLGLKLGEAVGAVQAEERVAAGLVEPDGKVAAIHEATHTHKSSRSGAGVAAAGSQTAAQAGAKVKP